MNDYAADAPLDADDERLLAAVASAQLEHDPVPDGLIDRLMFAVSLEIMEAELATLESRDLATVRSIDPVVVDTITFTASTTSFMVSLSESDGGVRIDGWVTGGGVEVELRAGALRLSRVSDATGRLTWEHVPHGPVRFLIQPSRPGQRPVVTPTIEV
ncbi:hypothetical protein [Tessaracoccus flavus]|uniref:Uncharacterized protein n=1 Tax=Tessaracoccus flavus TaxID=1610493 RepID=A0A1Q2CEF0_9ACTN|nr:hypothetical protein [Tessaracoccus flavus]AQP44499.1 hypothetical protein RPIT_06480 [Tessaracoccus flavus]SDY71352.1 hypothetical protein SAMN05428934_103241 [Tessaracoccus flavus]